MSTHGLIRAALRRHFGRVRTPARAAIAALTATATVMALATALPTAATGSVPAAADQPTKDVDAFLTSLSGFVGDLATVGEFGKQTPTLNLVPGSPDGFGLADLFDQTLAAAPLNGSLGGATTLGEVASNLDSVSNVDLGDGRHVSIDASYDAGAQQLPVTLHVTRDIQTGLWIDTKTAPFAFSSTTGVSAHLVMDLHFVIGYAPGSGGAEGYVYLLAGGSSGPTLTASIDSTGLAAATTKGAIGILGVHLADTSSYDVHAHLKASFADPNNDGQLAFKSPDGGGGFNPGELAGTGSAAGLVTADYDQAQTNDADGQLDFEALSSSLIDNLPSGAASVHVSAPDLSAADPVTATYGAGALATFEAFERLTPKDLADALAALQQMLTTAQLTKGNSTLTDNVDLPFMKGTLADLFQVSEAIEKFLGKYVEQIPADPHTSVSKTVGKPLFSSIQEMLDDLVNNPASAPLPPGTVFSLPTHAAYDNASGHEKLTFTLTIARSAPASQDLDPNAAALSSSTGTGVTYTPTSVTDPNDTFDAAVVTGRQVAAGDFKAAIKGVSGGGHTLDLDPAPLATAADPTPASDWKGATDAQPNPANGTPYLISAADAQVGAVQLGNDLKAASGLVSLNATIPSAKVTPSYEVNLPVVFDLSPPTSTTPTTITNADGSATVVDELPTPAQRVKIHAGVPLFWLDAPVTTHFSAGATVGFLGVQGTGDIAFCTAGFLNSSGATPACDPVTGDTHLVSLSLKAGAPGADTDGNLSLPALFSDLSASNGGTPHPENVFDGEVHGTAYGKVRLTVPGAATFFGTDHADITVSMADILDPTNVDVAGPDLSELTNLSAFDIPDTSDPAALFGALVNALTALDGILQKVSGSSPISDALKANIPLLGTSVQSLIGGGITGGDGATYGDVVDSDGHHHGTITDPAFARLTSDQLGNLVGRQISAGTVSGVVAAVSGTVPNQLVLEHEWQPVPAAGTSYGLADELNGGLSDLLANSADNLQDMLNRLAAKLGTNADGSSVVAFTVDTAVHPAVLKLDVNWKRGFTKNVPLQFKLDAYDVAGAQASGSIPVGVDADLHLKLQFPLSATAIASPAASLTIDKDSSISVQAHADVNNDLYFKANIGPLAVSLGDPEHPQATNVEAHAKFGVGLTDTDSGDPDTLQLSDFVSHLGAQLNAGVPAVQCSNAPATTQSENLAFCAALPLYTSADGGTHWNLIGSDVPSSSVLVRLPQVTSGVDNLGDQFDLTGTLADGTTDKVAVPADLLSLIANSFLDLSSLNDGLLGYFKFAEQAMQLASFNGQLPLIGKDLQQGADFIGKLRAALNTANFSGKPGSASAYRDAINNLGQKLDDAGVLPGGFSSSTFHVDITCSGKLAAVTPAPTAAATGGATDASYKYEVVAVRTDGGVGDTTPSADSNPVQNKAPADLGASDYNTVTWTSSPYADHYKILRAVDTGSGFGAFELVDTVDTSSLSYEDKKTTSSTYTAVGAAPDVHAVTCPDDAAGGDVEGITVSTDLGSGDLDDPAAHCTSTCVQTRPLSIGMPGLSFKAGDSGVDGNNGITAALAWSLHLKFGLSRDRGFYVATQDHGASDPANKSGPEFKVGVALDLPAHMAAQLAFLNIDIKKHPGATEPLFKGQFAIDLHDSGDADCAATTCAEDSSKFIDLAKIQNGGGITDFVTPLLSADANIDWDLYANTTVGSALPGIGAEFKLHWGWNNKSPGFAAPDVLEFDNVTIDPGQFLGDVLGKIFKQIADVTKPIQPILDTIQAEIPVLSDLSKAVGGDAITIATLAETFSTLAGGPDIKPFIDVVTKVVNIAKSLSGDCPGGQSFCVNVGSFDLAPDTAKTQQNNPDMPTDGYIQPTEEHTGNDSPLKQLNSDTSADIEDSGGATQGSDAHPGFTFPFLEHPASIFGLLMGKDVTLAQFDSGPLSLGFSFSESFGPVYAPPPVNFVIQGSAGVTVRIVAGFDTYGIRKAVENKKLDAGILDSLYFATTDCAVTPDNCSGKPIPVVSFTGSIAAGAEVSAVIIKAGVVGGITLTVNFYWHDPDNDGKFRFSEFLATALSNPMCLFDVGGELSLFIKVYITIGIDPFSVSFDFTLVNIKLLDFSLKPDCTPPPPRLGGVTGTTLYVYAGKLGTSAARGDDAWKSNNTADEAWKIQQKVDKSTGDVTGVTVSGLGITHTFTQPITSVVFDGRGYDGKLQVLVQNSKPLDTYVFGGNKDDTIKTGSGRSYIDGGLGNDSISAGDRPDPVHQALDDTQSATVAGGGGKDTITTGNGTDWVAGDSALNFDTTTSTSAPGYDTKSPDVADNTPVGTVALNGLIKAGSVGHPATPAEDASDDADMITTGIGGGEIWGGAGADKIGTSQASTVADANSGDATAKANLTPQPNTIVAGSGGDNVASGSASDTIYTGGKLEPGPDGVGWDDGAGVINTVDTGSGSDTVYGASGEDDVTVHSKTGEHATIYGAGGTDILDGGDGSDKIYGGPDNDYLIAQPAGVDKTNTHTDQLGVAYTVTLLKETPPSTSPKTLVGGGGKDRIIGGDGTTTIFGDHDTYPKDPGGGDFTPVDDPCVSPGPADSDAPVEHPNTGTNPWDGSPNAAQADAADLITGGAGVDTVQAGGGNDFVYTYGSNDRVCGEGGADTIDVGAGDDTAFAGSGNDTVYGQAGDDHLYGNADDDHIWGQDGADVIEGNQDTDTLSGGTGDDTIVGGTRYAARKDAGDFLYGDENDDTIVGDNATFPAGKVQVEDLTTNGVSQYGGADWIYGGNDDDKLYGGLDADHVYGGGGQDHAEGNSGADQMYGEAGADDIIGGSSQKVGGATMPDTGDTISGGAQDDVILGDNGSIDGTAMDVVLANRGLSRNRHVVLYDTRFDGAVDASKSGDDTINGDEQTDAIFGQGGKDVLHGDASGSTAAYDDYVEGGQDSDQVYGDGGQDDLVGGSHVATSGAGDLDAGDTIHGGGNGDVILGDNGLVNRVTDPAAASDLVRNRFDSDGSATALALRAITPYDQGDGPATGLFGADTLFGDAGGDVILGQRGDDAIQGNGDSDYAEGDSGADWIEGNGGNDDLVGGSSFTGGSVPAGQGQLDSGDTVYGGGGDDLVLGDNAKVNRYQAPNPLTHRIDAAGVGIPPRAFVLLDLAPGSGPGGAPTRSTYGADNLSGGGGTDVLLGQDGDDKISGGGDDDYAEGNGGVDTIWGDRLLPGLTAPATLTTVTDPQDTALPNGQDDLMGGSSTQGFRDGNDFVHGDGGSDYELGDNGSIVRDIVSGTTVLAANADLSGLTGLSNRVYTKRYATPAPAGAAYVRHSDPTLAPTTRFCVSTGTTCEPGTAFGDDTIWGDGGDDTLYGQDGKDTLYGDTGSTGGAPDGDTLTVGVTNDDDMYGELGDDKLFGEDGDDVMLGDRGGVVDQYENGNRQTTASVTQVPKVTYTAFASGTVTRITDLQHDVNGDAFVGSSTAAKMPHPGDLEGGNDQMRGGDGNDRMHGGFGDDLMNGDSGGDALFGDDGADVIWGGKGCDQAIDTLASNPGCYTNGVFDPSGRGTGDNRVDYILGGKGGTSTDSLTGDAGSDILDWHPRGTAGPIQPDVTCAPTTWPKDYSNGKGKTATITTLDPCSWFVMTNLDDTNVDNNQHHQGIDWQYGGWDRDVLQGDVADNGPNQGDRLLDWNGTYNLYTHCNSAYGGYNDVRQHSPDWQSFLQAWVFSLGAGQVAGDAANGSAGVGTSAFDELALVYPGGDNAHGSGNAFPSTPGHFDNPNACAP